MWHLSAALCTASLRLPDRLCCFGSTQLAGVQTGDGQAIFCRVTAQELNRSCTQDSVLNHSEIPHSFLLPPERWICTWNSFILTHYLPLFQGVSPNLPNTQRHVRPASLAWNTEFMIRERGNWSPVGPNMRTANFTRPNLVCKIHGVLGEPWA